MERYKEAQTSQLQDLQNELKSLKSLLVNRTAQRSFTPGVISSSATPPSALGMNGASGSGATEPLNTVNHTGAETPLPSVQGGGSSILPSRPGIPAWQLAAREKAQQAVQEDEENVQTA